ncbi:hypothetical protein ACIPX0_39680 [Streptomyces sp. NPDC090075]
MDILAFDALKGVLRAAAAGSPQDRFAAGMFLLVFAGISGYGLLWLMVRRSGEAQMRDCLVQLWDTLPHRSRPVEP